MQEKTVLGESTRDILHSCSWKDSLSMSSIVHFLGKEYDLCTDPQTDQKISEMSTNSNSTAEWKYISESIRG